MSTATLDRPVATTATRRPGFDRLLLAEWIKLSSVRSTWWTLATTVVLGAGLSILMCWGNADWLASADADESAGSFITWGMMIAPVMAVIIGALAVTTEYGTGMIRSTFAATPIRGRVLAAKMVVLAVVMFVVGTLTALIGYFGANPFLENEGIGLALEGDVARAMYGSGLYLAGIAVMTAAVGFILRHTAGTISVVLALLMVVGNMVMLVPGDLGDWLTKLMPGNAGSVIATPDPFNPFLLDAWPGLAVFGAEIAVLLVVAWVLVRRRDA